MKKFYLLLLFCSTISYSQEIKFGKVSKEELEEKMYPLDSTADAAYLYRYRRTYFDYSQQNGFEIVTEYQERIKIYTTEGFEFANKSIVYYNPETGNSESVSGIKAYTFNWIDGVEAKDKLSKKDIFDEKKNKFWSLKKITMPNVKVGSVIDLEYQIRSPYKSISDAPFQFEIPVKQLEYSIQIPEYFNYNMRTKGYYFVSPIESSGSGSLTINSKSRVQGGYTNSSTSYSNNKINYQTNIKEFTGKDIPALKDNEPFVSNIDTYRGGVTFELASTNFIKVGGDFKNYTSSWEDVSKQIFKSADFGQELNKTSYFKDDLNSILATAKTETDKTIAIFQFVKNQVKWNGYYGIYSDKGVKKAYKEREGNVADINLILTSMLREAGVEANPVLVSTRSNGVPLFPTLEGFNYVIAMVEFPDNTYMLLDATEPYSLPNILPTRALNWNGRKVTKEGDSSWVALTSSAHALEENNVHVKISDDLNVEGLFRTKYANLNALSYRSNNNAVKEEDLVTKLEEKNGIEIEDFKVLNKDKIVKSIVRSVKFTTQDLVETINDKLYIEPLLFLTQHANPFKLEDRKFPVDFATPWKDKNTVSIQIPDGYKIESIPESMAIGLPENLGVFKYQISQNANKINTICALEFNQSIISPKYYAVLKEFYSQLVKKESEKIVLVKQ